MLRCIICCRRALHSLTSRWVRRVAVRLRGAPPAGPGGHPSEGGPSLQQFSTCRSTALRAEVSLAAFGPAWEGPRRSWTKSGGKGASPATLRRQKALKFQACHCGAANLPTWLKLNLRKA